MTDLTEMVEWLRTMVTGDLEKAKEAAEHPQMIQSFTGDLSDEEAEEIRQRLMKGGPTKLIALDEPATVVHDDPGDTIARREAELGIIDDYERARRKLESGPDPRAPGSVFLSGRHDALRGAITRLVYGYRHRDGYKASWTA